MHNENCQNCQPAISQPPTHTLNAFIDVCGRPHASLLPSGFRGYHCEISFPAGPTPRVSHPQLHLPRPVASLFLTIFMFQFFILCTGPAFVRCLGPRLAASKLFMHYAGGSDSMRPPQHPSTPSPRRLDPQKLSRKCEIPIGFRNGIVYAVYGFVIGKILIDYVGPGGGHPRSPPTNSPSVVANSRLLWGWRRKGGGRGGAAVTSTRLDRVSPTSFRKQGTSVPVATLPPGEEQHKYKAQSAERVGAPSVASEASGRGNCALMTE